MNNDGVAGTIQNGIDFRNHQFVAQADGEEHLKKIANWKSTFNPLTRVMGDESVTPTLTSNEWRDDHAGMLLIGEGLEHEANLRGMFRDEKPTENEPSVHKLGSYNPNRVSAGPVVDQEGIAPTLLSEHHGNVMAIPIKNATKQGYLLAKEGDGIDISGRMEHHRGTVQDGLAQTVNTNCDVGVVVSE